jgi:putative flavoprotein involved in K+ transport
MDGSGPAAVGSVTCEASWPIVVVMSEAHDVVVIGGGQAGLVASHALTERDVDHVVLERAYVGERWRAERWDSLRFQFPNTVLSLPGMPYDGQEPDGYAHYREVLHWVQRYATEVRAPVREQTAVTSLVRRSGGWLVMTDQGVIRCRAVVLATGPFQRARVPTVSADLPRSVHQLHSADYRRPDLLPDGAVLVVGSGASGAQIAEDLIGAGRTTYLCVSRHRRVPRRFLGRDVFAWLVEIGLMDRTRADWVDDRMPPTVLVTGVGGGHDLNLRDLEEHGTTLLGTLRGVMGDRMHLADDAEAILAAADQMCDETVRAISVYAAAPCSDIPPSETRRDVRPRVRPSRLSLREAGITSIIWSTGYSFDYDWVQVPCLSSAGQPLQQRGVGEVDGLYFLGLHWMHTFKSGTFLGIGEDADYVTAHLVTHVLRS